MRIKIAIILGTRPEIIKMSPLIRELEKQKIDFFICHTNQHYSYDLDEIFFKELNLPTPKYNLRIGSGTHGEQTGKMLIAIEKVLIKEKPSLVLVEGDTNTVLAGALAAVKLHIKLGHIEAGLRSDDKKMPEEINRIIADHCSDLLFTPTVDSKAALIEENIPREKIIVTGNPIVDAIFYSQEIAKKSSNILEKLKILPKKYFLLTLHRQENVDQEKKLREIFESLTQLSKNFKLPIICPLHPRTRKKLKKFKIKVDSQIKIIEPLGYLDFLNLQNNAKLILTDSGGIQEEACILQIPCVTLRENTERPETIKVGANLLAGSNYKRILRASQTMLQRRNNWQNPFGNGESAKKIVEAIT